MTVVAWLMIGIVVIGGALYIVTVIFAGVAGVANSVWSSIHAVLGRKKLGIKAFVPEGLSADADPLPKRDPDKDAVTDYAPGKELSLHRPATVFQPMPEPESTLREPERSIDIARVREILAMSFELPYARLVSAPQNAYPVPAPETPAEAARLPSWTPWRPVFEEPTFEPPYLTGALSILNRFVDEAYQEESAKVRAALWRREDLLERCEKRNKAVSALADQAEERRLAFNKRRERKFAEATAEWEKDAAAWNKAAFGEKARIDARVARLRLEGEAGLMARIDLAMRTVGWPLFVSGEGETRFDAESGVLIHEHRFPDPSEVAWLKVVQLKAGPTIKPANKADAKEAAAKLHPSLCLRLAAELLRLDTEGIVKALAINGWADYTEKSTGQRKRAYCASLFATREQVVGLNLRSLEPVAAFSALKGICARSMELTPIAPVIRLDTNDPRFVDAKLVLSRMAEGENLASMDWEDFEHLCRELFERAFAGSGAEVKVTQASRDQGVDAVVFDPDPIRGGKIVIQAKRYTNTVDVSAVRDLYGSVINEGATKGILVTTSHFGPEAYSFAKDKPLTLLNGNELLGLLETHGYKFRINLAEAKSLL